MNSDAIATLIDSCDKIARRTFSSSVRLFDACMRTFDGEAAANAIAFEVFIDAPVMAPGYVKIFRDGSFQMATKKALKATGQLHEWLGD